MIITAVLQAKVQAPYCTTTASFVSLIFKFASLQVCAVFSRLTITTWTSPPAKEKPGKQTVFLPITVNYSEPDWSQPETEGASCHSSPVDEPVIGPRNYQWLPWSSARLKRPRLSLPTMLPGLLNIKHLFVLEAWLLLSLRLPL